METDHDFRMVMQKTGDSQSRKLLNISISHYFKDLDELARYFATVMAEVEQYRNSDEETYNGTDWNVEVLTN